jgi:hypothetical protein
LSFLAYHRSFVTAGALALCPELPSARCTIPGLLEARHLAFLGPSPGGRHKISVSGSWAPEELTALSTMTTGLVDPQRQRKPFAAVDPKLAPDRLQG